LVPAYLHGWLVTGNERYREVAEETLDYMLRELRLPEGGFASAQDADTDGVEGLTYTWTEGDHVPRELLQPFEHGRFIVRGELDRETRARLFAERELRPKPLRDDKAIASWNGLALAALAESGRRLDRVALLAIELFGDKGNGGFFRTAADAEPLVVRKKDLDDHPTPSGNSMLAYVLLRLGRLWGDPELERQAVGVFRLVARLLPQAPSAF